MLGRHAAHEALLQSGDARLQGGVPAGRLLERVRRSPLARRKRRRWREQQRDLVGFQVISEGLSLKEDNLLFYFILATVRAGAISFNSWLWLLHAVAYLMLLLLLLQLFLLLLLL